MSGWVAQCQQFLSVSFSFSYLKLLKGSRQGCTSNFDCVNSAMFPHMKKNLKGLSHQVTLVVSGV